MSENGLINLTCVYIANWGGDAAPTTQRDEKRLENSK